MSDPAPRPRRAASRGGSSGADDRRRLRSPSPLVRLLILAFIISVIGLTLIISLLVRDDPEPDTPTTTTEAIMTTAAGHTISTWGQ